MSDDGTEEAHCYINGQFYKIGRLNRVFVHRNDEWVFTDGMPLSRLLDELHKEARDENSRRTSWRYTL